VGNNNNKVTRGIAEKVFSIFRLLFLLDFSSALGQENMHIKRAGNKSKMGGKTRTLNDSFVRFSVWALPCPPVRCLPFSCFCRLIGPYSGQFGHGRLHFTLTVEECHVHQGNVFIFECTLFQGIQWNVKTLEMHLGSVVSSMEFHQPQFFSRNLLEKVYWRFVQEIVAFALLKKKSQSMQHFFKTEILHTFRHLYN